MTIYDRTHSIDLSYPTPYVEYAWAGLMLAWIAALVFAPNGWRPYILVAPAALLSLIPAFLFLTNRPREWRILFFVYGVLIPIAAGAVTGLYVLLR